MNHKHTAGPWQDTGEYDKKPFSDKGWLYTTIIADNSEKPALAIVYGETKQECQANAAVIAAAPELLEALQTVLSRVEHTNIHTPIGEMQDTWQILRAAIAKAEGRQ